MENNIETKVEKKFNAVPIIAISPAIIALIPIFTGSGYFWSILFGIASQVLGIIGCTKHNIKYKALAIIAIVLGAVCVVGGVIGGAIAVTNSAVDAINESIEVTEIVESTTTEDTTVSEETEEVEEIVPSIVYVGSTVELTNGVAITFENAYVNTNYDSYSTPEDGYEYRTYTFLITYNGDDSIYASTYDFTAFADNMQVEEDIWCETENGSSADLSSGRSGRIDVTFCVPTDATEVEVEYEYDMWNGDNIVFDGNIQ